MGAAESISDLRSLLSIVAEETGALKMSDADEDSVGWTTEGQLPMTFGHVRRAHSALAALEAALSAAEPGTEPTIYVSRKSLEQLEEEGSHVAVQTLIHRKPLKSGNGVPLYAAPPAPSVAAKALDDHTMQKLREALRFSASRSVMSAADETRILSALSAQVQDVPRYEADRLRRMVERRDEFIISKGLWNDFKEVSHEAG